MIQTSSEMFIESLNSYPVRQWPSCTIETPREQPGIRQTACKTPYAAARLTQVGDAYQWQPQSIIPLQSD
jgi:hypothetical protein